MSVEMKLGTKVSGRDLFERLKQFGIREALTPDNDERARCLTDGRHCLWVYLTEDGFVSSLTMYGVCVPNKILDAIWETFGEIYTEHDPQYWGCDTQEEWEAAMPEIAGQLGGGEQEPDRDEALDAKIAKWLAEAIPVPGGYLFKRSGR
jgi:hypothetical protein